MPRNIFPDFSSFNDFIKNNENFKTVGSTGVDNSREAEHTAADFVKDDEEFASKNLIKITSDLKELYNKQYLLRKEFFTLSRKRDLVKRKEIQKELVKIYREIFSLDHEFQRLIELEEPEYNENI